MSANSTLGRVPRHGRVPIGCVIAAMALAGCGHAPRTLPSNVAKTHVEPTPVSVGKSGAVLLALARRRLLQAPVLRVHTKDHAEDFDITWAGANASLVLQTKRHTERIRRVGGSVYLNTDNGIRWFEFDDPNDKTYRSLDRQLNRTAFVRRLLHYMRPAHKEGTFYPLYQSPQDMLGSRYGDVLYLAQNDGRPVSLKEDDGEMWSIEYTARGPVVPPLKRTYYLDPDQHA